MALQFFFHFLAKMAYFVLCCVEHPLVGQCATQNNHTPLLYESTQNTQNTTNTKRNERKLNFYVQQAPQRPKHTLKHTLNV